MKYTAGYPDLIEEYANMLTNRPEVAELFEDAGLTNFQDFFEITCQFCLSKFLNGDEIILNEKEFTQAISYSIVNNSLAKLEREGLVFNISSDNEEPEYILTEKGRKLLNSM